MTAAFALTGASLSEDSTTFQLTGATLVVGSTVSFALTGASIDPTGALNSVEAGNNITVDPFSRMQLSAIVNGTPDTVTWSLVSATNGAVPLLIGTGASVIYYAPATVNGTVLVWQVTAVKAGQPNVTDTVTHTIRNHAGPWFVIGAGVYRPVQISALQGPDVIPA